MSDASNRIVQKLWSYCNVLRDHLRSALAQIEDVLGDLEQRAGVSA